MVSEGLHGFFSYYFSHATTSDLYVMHKTGELIYTVSSILNLFCGLVCFLVAIGLLSLLHSLDVTALVEKEDNGNGNQCQENYGTIV